MADIIEVIPADKNHNTDVSTSEQSDRLPNEVGYFCNLGKTNPGNCRRVITMNSILRMPILTKISPVLILNRLSPIPYTIIPRIEFYFWRSRKSFENLFQMKIKHRTNFKQWIHVEKENFRRVCNELFLSLNRWTNDCSSGCGVLRSRS